MALITLTPGLDGFPTNGGAAHPTSVSARPMPALPATDIAGSPGKEPGSVATQGAVWSSGTAFWVSRRVFRELVNGAGTLLVAGAVVVFLFLAVGPRFFGYQTATMLTGSMAPSIVPGDVVVTTKQPVAEVTVGDVISYHIPVEDHRVETHRVIEVITNPDGTTAIRTKGDANEFVDPWIATLDGDYVYEQAFIVPGVGDLIRALRKPIVSNALVYGAPAVLVIGLLTMIWSRPTHDAGLNTDNATDNATDSPTGATTVNE